MSIWNEGDVDWGTGDGLRAVQLFERAYSDHRAAEAVADRVGIPWPRTADRLGRTELWTELFSAAASGGRQLALAADLLQDPIGSRFAVPLGRLLGERATNAIRVARQGFPPPGPERDAVVAHIDPALMADAILPGAGLQTINAPGAGIPDPVAIERALSDARRRTILVRRGRTPVGTGFLVGPDLLLTAAHVVRPDGAMPEPGDVEDVDVVLDYYAGQGSSLVETGTSVRVLELLRASPASDHELAAGMDDDWDAPDDRLDYALLRLAARVGEQTTDGTPPRCWYTLETIAPDLTRSTIVRVYHFPLGAMLATSPLIDTITLNPAGTQTRMRYRTNTLPGSSGAPVVDEQGKLLGMHHYGTPTHNQAVPIWKVAQALQDLLQDLPPDEPAADQPSQGQAPAAAPPARPYDVLQVGPRPVVNRTELRQKLWAAMTRDDAARSLVIVGESSSGVSWSWWLLSHLAAQAEHVDELRDRAPGGVHAIEVDMRRTLGRPAAERRAALIKTVTGRIGDAPPDERIDQAARQVSDFKDWCYGKLVASNAQWWIFVDSIDETTDFDRAGVGEVLAALVDLADDPQTKLRVVLGGRCADQLPHRSLSWAATDTPSGLTRQEVKTWLEARARQCDRSPAADLVEGFLNRWFGSSQRAQQPLELSLQLPAAVQEVSS